MKRRSKSAVFLILLLLCSCSHLRDSDNSIVPQGHIETIEFTNTAETDMCERSKYQADHEIQLRDAILHSASSDTRLAAAACLGELENIEGSTIDALVNVTVEDTDMNVRTASSDVLRVAAISKQLTAPQIERLLLALDDSDPRVRANIANAMGQVQPQFAGAIVSQLIDLLDDSNTSVQGNSALSLGALLGIDTTTYGDRYNLFKIDPVTLEPLIVTDIREALARNP